MRRSSVVILLISKHFIYIMVLEAILSYTGAMFDGMDGEYIEKAIEKVGGPKGIRKVADALKWLSKAYKNLACDKLCLRSDCIGIFFYCSLKNVGSKTLTSCHECKNDKQYDPFVLCNECKLLLCNSCSLKEDLNVLRDEDSEGQKLKKQKTHHYSWQECSGGKISELLKYRQFREGNYWGGKPSKEWKTEIPSGRSLKKDLPRNEEKRDDETDLEFVFSDDEEYSMGKKIFFASLYGTTSINK